MATCFCIGPQNGAPLCPCKMKQANVFDINSRWIEIIDHGPVVKELEKEFIIVDSAKLYADMMTSSSEVEQ